MRDTDDSTTETSTRRDALRYGGTLVTSAALAGCSDLVGQSDGSGDQDDEGTYSVSMEPMGTVAFDEVPERWAAYDGGYADMAVALGQADGLAGVGGADRYYTYVYDELPGVTVDEDVLEQYPEVRTKEEFYELESDVHLYDPQMLVNWFDWGEGDVDEIATNVAPFVGNLIFRRSDDWHDYRYYTLYEAFEKVADVFQARARYEAFSELHDGFIASIRERLPPSEDRPEVFLTFEGTDEPETFSPYRLDDAGTSKKQWRDLGVHDALTGTDIDNLSTTNRGELDYENLLEIDPEVILVRGHERKSAAEFRDVVLDYMLPGFVR